MIFLYIEITTVNAMIVQTYNIPLLMDDANATHWHNILICARDAYNTCTKLLHESKASLSLKNVQLNIYCCPSGWKCSNYLTVVVC